LSTEKATEGGEGIRSARAYAVVAVVLVMAASLGAVSLAWGEPGAGSTSDDPINPEPYPAGGNDVKQTPLLMRVLDPPEPVKGTDGKYHLVYELVLTNSSPGTAVVASIKTLMRSPVRSWTPLPRRCRRPHGLAGRHKRADGREDAGRKDLALSQQKLKSVAGGDLTPYTGSRSTVTCD
jgi:hypothetical protein